MALWLFKSGFTSGSTKLLDMVEFAHFLRFKSSMEALNQYRQDIKDLSQRLALLRGYL